VLTKSVNSRWPSTWWQHCSETVNRNNFVIFRRRSKRIAILESVFFYYVCLYANFSIFVVVMWPILGTIQGLYLPNAWSQTLQTGKRHTFRVSAFHRYHWFGVQLYPVRCAQHSRWVPLKCEKCCFGIWLRPRYKIPEFSQWHPSSPTLWRFSAEIAAICRLYIIGVAVFCKYYKKLSRFGLAWSRSRARAPIAV